jgi:hypothetical protein
MMVKIMATIINNPDSGERSGSGLVVGVILVIVILLGIALFFIYGLPMIQNNQKPNDSNIDVNVKLPDVKIPNVTIPTPTPSP